MRSRLALGVVVFAVASLGGAHDGFARLSSVPGVYDARAGQVHLQDRMLDVTFVTPAKPRAPQLLVLFASGDAGFMGACGELFEHLARGGYTIVAYDSRDLVAHAKRSGGLVDIPVAAEAIDGILVESRRALGLPDATRVLVTGYSRGANLVVFAAGVKKLQGDVAGGIAVALTRETDFLRAPEASLRPPALQVDDRGRIQTYPAIALAGEIPFAVIQSKGDKYVPSEEARRLFGPDTPKRRLYEVDARNHGFGGGREEMLRDFDDALAWIEGRDAGGE